MPLNRVLSWMGLMLAFLTPDDLDDLIAKVWKEPTFFQTRPGPFASRANFAEEPNPKALMHDNPKNPGNAPLLPSQHLARTIGRASRKWRVDSFARHILETSRM